MIVPSVSGASEMHKNRAVKRLLGLLSIGIACGTINLIQPHERFLLSRCSVVARKDQFDTYNWQSDHSILLFRKRPEFPYPWSLESVDLVTRRRIAYPVLAKQFEHWNITARAFEISMARNFETSPDGKWLLWGTTDSKTGIDTGPSTGWLANLQTGRIDRFPIGSTAGEDTSEPHHLYWMADSTHFVEFNTPRTWWRSPGRNSGGGATIIRNVNAAQQRKTLKLRSDWKLEPWAGIHVLSEEHVVATTLTIYNRTEDYSGPPVLVQTSLKSSGSPAQCRPLALPHGTLFMEDVAFSPKGDRYAVSASVDSHPIWMDVLHRHHWMGRMPSHPEVGIWIFSLDGKESHVVGKMKPERNSDAVLWPYEMPRDLRWSPDGKQLGFVYKGVLYRVPTD
jgi:hypothetical protein